MMLEVRLLTWTRLRSTGGGTDWPRPRAAPASTGLLPAITTCVPMYLLADCGSTTSALLVTSGGWSTVNATPASAPSTAQAPTTNLCRRTIRIDLRRSSACSLIRPPLESQAFPLLGIGHG